MKTIWFESYVNIKWLRTPYFLYELGKEKFDSFVNSLLNLVTFWICPYISFAYIYFDLYIQLSTINFTWFEQNETWNTMNVEKQWFCWPLIIHNILLLWLWHINWKVSLGKNWSLRGVVNFQRTQFIFMCNLYATHVYWFIRKKITILV